MKLEEIEFLRELTILSRKHRIQVSGCGCCHSPFYKITDEELEGAYRETDANEAGDSDVEWVILGLLSLPFVEAEASSGTCSSKYGLCE